MSRFRSAPRRSATTGHTLWEMLLVLALVGALATLVAPSRTALRSAARSDDVKNATSEITALLARARLTAVERATTVVVLLDPMNARTWTFIRVGDDLRLAGDSTVSLAPGVDLLADAVRIRFTFYATGTATAGAVLVRGIGGTRHITVDPWSGAPHVDAR
jgi:Tfp pilus assembly protein FimT